MAETIIECRRIQPPTACRSIPGWVGRASTKGRRPHEPECRKLQSRTACVDACKQTVKN